MHKITIINNNQTSIVECNNNENLLNVLRRNNIFINASCGGNGTCKKCKVSYQNEFILSCNTFVRSDMTVVLPSNRNLSIESNKNLVNDNSVLSLAIDLGTTTVAAYLIDINLKKEIAQFSVLNMQSLYGSDVITRIQKCNEGYLDKLHLTIINQINEIIIYFKNKYKINQIEEIVVAGNPTMLHILANINPKSMGAYPFTPVFLEEKIIDGIDLGLNTNKITLLPSISAFIGSDVVCGILSTDLLKEENVLLVDIGTNGEIILKTKDCILGCSTAAGPAFEGAKIECGLGGIEGAVAKFYLEDKKLKFETISGEAKGICGSGLVDLIALLLEEELIDETGTFSPNINSVINSNLINDKFYFYKDLYLSQKDIREFQLAKSAIMAGIITILSVANINKNNISKLYLAGGFGYYLNIKNAIKVGIIPHIEEDKIVSVGNSSGLGAKMVLLNNSYLQECIQIAKEVRTINLSTNKVFTENFIENMYFNL